MQRIFADFPQEKFKSVMNRAHIRLPPIKGLEVLWNPGRWNEAPFARLAEAAIQKTAEEQLLWHIQSSQAYRFANNIEVCSRYLAVFNFSWLFVPSSY